MEEAKQAGERVSGTVTSAKSHSQARDGAATHGGRVGSVWGAGSGEETGAVGPRGDTTTHTCHRLGCTSPFRMCSELSTQITVASSTMAAGWPGNRGGGASAERLRVLPPRWQARRRPPVHAFRRLGDAVQDGRAGGK